MPEQRGPGFCFPAFGSKLGWLPCALEHSAGDVLQPVLCGVPCIPVFRRLYQLLELLLFIGAGAKASMEVLTQNAANELLRYTPIEAVEGINADRRQFDARAIKDVVLPGPLGVHSSQQLRFAQPS